jgi:isoprenylcysteine carboxyl methyltransferase (ICMT) family protein YpbQ
MISPTEAAVAYDSSVFELKKEISGFSSWEPFRAFVRRAGQRRQIWDTVPQRSKLMLLAMVICLFGAIGVVSQLDSSTASQFKLWAAALFIGVFAVAYAWVAIQKIWLWFFVLLPLQAIATSIVFAYVRRYSPEGTVVPDSIKPWLGTSPVMTLFLMSAAYVLMMSFITREGDRFFRSHTEIQLAGEIHKALVSTIHRQSQGYEFYGASLASGVVGGDLVDVIERNGHWLAYVADVAGHGVSSGVLMAMIKSATSMYVRFDPAAHNLLRGLNDVLCSLKTGNMPATFGFLSGSPERGLHYSLAGHLPVLLVRSDEIRFLAGQNVPLGLFSDAAFESTELQILPGDILAILTDGLTEIVNQRGQELGIEEIAGIVRKLKDRPVDEIAVAVFNQAGAYGMRNDDKTLLLVRKL